MPEIGEVARVVHFLNKFLVGKTIAKVVAPEDANVFGKVGCSGPAFEKALTGRKVLAAGRQGKYFWLQMDKPPHPVMHLGMTGWVHIKGEQTYYYKRSTPEEQTDWPPRFWKFTIETKGSAKVPAVEAAFTDSRRFARIRLIDCPGDAIRQATPLVENGPDPIVDSNVLTLEWLTEIMRKKKVPVKALLLDQANISGIGNWVGDEIMYHARLHPEQYSNTFSDEQLKQLHDSIMFVCGLAVETLSDSSRFPAEWLFKHRWGKGKKDAPTTLPNGAKITFLTVGGRTSCIVPSLQKKTGAVAGDVKKEDLETEASENVDDDDDSIKALETQTPKSKSTRKKAKTSNNSDAVGGNQQKTEADETTKNDSRTGKRKRTAPVDVTEQRRSRKRKAVPAETTDAPAAPLKSEELRGRRRSGRIKR